MSVHICVCIHIYIYNYIDIGYGWAWTIWSWWVLPQHGDQKWHFAETHCRMDHRDLNGSTTTSGRRRHRRDSWVFVYVWFRLGGLGVALFGLSCRDGDCWFKCLWQNGRLGCLMPRHFLWFEPPHCVCKHRKQEKGTNIIVMKVVGLENRFAHEGTPDLSSSLI